MQMHLLSFLSSAVSFSSKCSPCHWKLLLISLEYLLLSIDFLSFIYISVFSFQHPSNMHFSFKHVLLNIKVKIQGGSGRVLARELCLWLKENFYH